MANNVFPEPLSISANGDTNSESNPIYVAVVSDPNSSEASLLEQINESLKNLEELIQAEGTAHASGDKGIQALAVQQDSDMSGPLASDGEYAPHLVTRTGRLKVSPNAFHILDLFTATTGFSALNDDAGNITTSLNHIIGSASVQWDKLNGTANTTDAIIQKTITSLNLLNAATAATFLQAGVLIPDLTDVTHVVIRLGTDASNYNEWAIPSDEMTENMWNQVRVPIVEATGYAGNGWDTQNVTYMAVGFRFNLQSNTLAGLLWDGLVIVGGTVTDAQISAASSVNTPNVNVVRLAGNNIATAAGNSNNGTQRVILANNDPLVSNVGETADAAASAGGAGTVSAKLRRLTTDLDLVASATKLEDAASSSGERGMSILGRRNNAGSTITSTDGDHSWLAVDEAGRAMVAPRGMAVVTTDGFGGTFQSPANELGALFHVVYGYHFNGTNWDRIRGNTSGQFQQGPAARDAVIAGNPVIQGGRASDVAPSAVSANGDAVEIWLSRSGAQMVQRAPSTTGTNSTVAATTSSNTTIIASNAARRGATVENDSLLANLFISLGATCTTTNFTKRIAPGGYYEVPYDYNGVVTGVWSAASGNARVTELT